MLSLLDLEAKVTEEEEEEEESGDGGKENRFVYEWSRVWQGRVGKDMDKEDMVVGTGDKESKVGQGRVGMDREKEDTVVGTQDKESKVGQGRAGRVVP